MNIETCDNIYAGEAMNEDNKAFDDWMDSLFLNCPWGMVKRGVRWVRSNGSKANTGSPERDHWCIVTWWISGVCWVLLVALRSIQLFNALFIWRFGSSVRQTCRLGVFEQFWCRNTSWWNCQYLRMQSSALDRTITMMIMMMKIIMMITILPLDTKVCIA